MQEVSTTDLRKNERYYLHCKKYVYNRKTQTLELSEEKYVMTVKQIELIDNELEVEFSNIYNYSTKTSSDQLTLCWGTPTDINGSPSSVWTFYKVNADKLFLQQIFKQKLQMDVDSSLIFL